MNDSKEFKAQTLAIRKEFLEKLQAKAYWDRTTQKEVLDQALEQYLKNKKVKPIPGGKK